MRRNRNSKKMRMHPNTRPTTTIISSTVVTSNRLDGTGGETTDTGSGSGGSGTCRAGRLVFLRHDFKGRLMLFFDS